jgi:hypothetical protein
MRAGFGSNDDSGAQTYSASESETRQVAKDGIAGTKSLDAPATATTLPALDPRYRSAV